jgi:lipoprotein signal peptidase
MKKNLRLWFFCTLSGIFFIFDRFLKSAAISFWHEPRMVFPFFGWGPFLNQGIAFSIPVPNLLIIIITVPIIFGLFVKIIQDSKKISGDTIPFLKNKILHTWISFLFIFCGALSNLIDRIIYHATIDYFAIYTAIINIADILIFIGFVIYFLSALKEKPPES